MTNKIELTVQQAMALIQVAASAAENNNLISLKKPKEMTDGQHLALVADMAVKISNARGVLAELDVDEAIHPLLPLPRDGVRWKDR
jgi:hypothetical protein